MGITYIDPDKYHFVPKDEYEKKKKEKDDYILDFKNYAYEALDGSGWYYPTLERIHELEDFYGVELI